MTAGRLFEKKSENEESFFFSFLITAFWNLSYTSLSCDCCFRQYYWIEIEISSAIEFYLFLTNLRLMTGKDSVDLVCINIKDIYTDMDSFFNVSLS